METDSLFVERIAKRHYDRGLTPKFTLFEKDKVVNGKTIPSMYRLFMECVDEYDAAIKLLGSWAHWEKLRKVKWFSQSWVKCPAHRGADAWIVDMQKRDMSAAKKVLLEAVENGDTTAAKKLADMVSKTASAYSRGRPKNEEVVRQAASIAEEKAAVEDDLKRLNVVRIRG